MQTSLETEPAPTSTSTSTGVDPARRAWQAITDLTFHLRAIWTAIAAELQLTPAQAFALRMLPRAGLPMNALAQLLLCEASSLTGIVDKLEARGAIERHPSREDRRVKVVVLTPLGQSLRRRLLARTAEPPEALRGLGDEDLAHLARLLRQIAPR